MLVSVVMATWQGERYLPDQLATLMGQVRPPDELVVVDDRSTDGTTAILEDFAQQAPFPVHLHRNDVHQGSTRSFETGIQAARGELIALADQDDLWMPQKLTRLEAALGEQPDALFAFSDASLIDEEGNGLPQRMWAARNFGSEEQELLRRDPFGVLVHRSLVTGCTVIFRAEARDLLLPIPGGGSDLEGDEGCEQPIIHDRWLSLVLSAAGPVVAVAEPLVAYRIHADQQVGLPAPSPESVRRHLTRVISGQGAGRERRVHHLAYLEEVRRRVEGHRGAGPATREHVDAVVEHLTFRQQHARRRWSRVGPILREGFRGRYHQYSNGASSMIADLLEP